MKQITARSTWWQIILWAGGFAFVPYMVANAMGVPFISFEQSLFNFTGLGVLVLLNLELLLPQLYFKQKNFIYMLAAIGLILLIASIIYWNGTTFEREFDQPPSGNWHRPKLLREGIPFRGFRVIGRTMPFFIALIGSSLVAIGEYARQKEKEAIQLEKEKLETEMKFLKSQINPHFLFNALNNVYTLTLIKSDEAPANLLRLSDMLRYMLYDCNAEKVLLEKEVAYLKNYIQLKQLKDSGGLNIQLDLQDSYPQKYIAPLLFVPFIENAFKHSKIEDLNSGWIKMELKTTPEEVYFRVQNSLPSNGYTKDKIGGIGLDNVHRQLELMYPRQHFLSIEKKSDHFDVQLRITTK
ncbi:MAG: histidine kinase [Saprospiraceae bacterium]